VPPLLHADCQPPQQQQQQQGCLWGCFQQQQQQQQQLPRQTCVAGRALASESVPQQRQQQLLPQGLEGGTYEVCLCPVSGWASPRPRLKWTHLPQLLLLPLLLLLLPLLLLLLLSPILLRQQLG
jgi:hypothetical protein